jgi:hypothetical protein
MKKGTKVNIKSLNKNGVVMSSSNNRVSVMMEDGTAKVFDANDVEMLKSGGQVKAKRKYSKGGDVKSLENKINSVYKKSGFINDDFNWKLKLLEMLQDSSNEAYNIYQSLSAEQKEQVLQEQYEVDNDMGSDGDGTLETTQENIEIMLKDAKKGKKYAKGGNADVENNEMVLNNNKQIKHHTEELPKAIKGKKVPAWVVAKVNRSASDLSDATHYMDGQGSMYRNGGGVNMHSKFHLNQKGNFSAKINNKGYEIIYRDDVSKLYDLFENGKKIKSSRSVRDLMQFPKQYANGGGVNDIEQNLKVGNVVELSESGWDNENYHNFFDGVDNVKLVVTDVYKSTSEHQGFDSGVGMALYSTKRLDNNEVVPFDLYDYELEYVSKGKKYADGGVVGQNVRGIAYYITSDSAGDDYRYLSGSFLSKEEFDKFYGDDAILDFYFNVNVEYDWQLEKAIYQQMLDEEVREEGIHIIGYKISRSDNDDIESNLPYDDNEDYANGGRLTSNEDIIEAFLTSNKEAKVGNISTHYNEYDNQMLLRNYGTLIASRKGNNLDITSIKYSVTTTKITNMVNRMAKDKGLNVKYVEKFEDGGMTSSYCYEIGGL